MGRGCTAGVRESFQIELLACAESDPCTRVRRILPSAFNVDLVRAEQLELETGGGRDSVLTQPLPGLMQVLDGVGPTIAATGVDFSRSINCRWPGSVIRDPRPSYCRALMRFIIPIPAGRWFTDSVTGQAAVHHARGVCLRERLAVSQFDQELAQAQKRPSGAPGR